MQQPPVCGLKIVLAVTSYMKQTTNKTLPGRATLTHTTPPQHVGGVYIETLLLYKTS